MKHTILALIMAFSFSGCAISGSTLGYVVAVMAGAGAMAENALYLKDAYVETKSAILKDLNTTKREDVEQ